jgi:GntR family transcriptional regulator
LKLVKDPIYQQLNQILRDLIRKGEFTVGQKFLTEREVCERYDVSRATANKALSSLVSEGLLEFRKGVGTFVRAGPADGGLVSSFTENVKDAGKRPHTRVLEFRQIPAAELLAEASAKLGLEPDEQVYEVERLRLADRTPMMLEHRFVPSRLCPDLRRADFEGSFFALISDRYDLEIVGEDETIHAVTIGRREAELLGVAAGGAGLLVVSVGYVKGDLPLWWESTLHHPDGFEFRCRVRPTRTERGVERHMLFDGGSAGKAKR